MAALIGLGTILAALTLVWLVSVKRRDTSVADICWGLGFVLLVPNLRSLPRQMRRSRRSVRSTVRRGRPGIEIACHLSSPARL